MDPIRILEPEHREIERLFAEIDDASGDERATSVDQLLITLRAHMTLEEEVVYPVIVTWGAAMAGAQAAVSHRVEEEERDVLPTVREKSPELLEQMFNAPARQEGSDT